MIMAMRGIDNKATLAPVLGIHKDALYNKLNGRRPWTLDDVSKFAAHFGISESALVGDVQSIVEPRREVIGGYQAGSSRCDPTRYSTLSTSFPQATRRAANLGTVAARPGTLVSLDHHRHRRRITRPFANATFTQVS